MSDSMNNVLKDLPQIAYTLSGGSSEKDWSVHAINLSFEEALEFSKMLGESIVRRREARRAALAQHERSQTEP